MKAATRQLPSQARSSAKVWAARSRGVAAGEANGTAVAAHEPGVGLERCFDGGAHVVFVAASGGEQPQRREHHERDGHDGNYEQLAANWPTTHATSKPMGGRSPLTVAYRPVRCALEL